MSAGPQLRLLLAGLAASYIGFVLASAGLYVIPGLVLMLIGRAELEWFRISAVSMRLGLSGESSTAAVVVMRTWGLAGAALPLIAAQRGPAAIRLVLLQTACWWFLLHWLTAFIGQLLARRWSLGAWRGAALALGGLVVSLALLARFLRAYAGQRFGNRAAAVAGAFCLPAALAIADMGRWTRLPAWSLFAVAAALVVLGASSSALVRTTVETGEWPVSSMRRLVIVAVLLAAGLATFPRVHRAAQDFALERVQTEHQQILYSEEQFDHSTAQQLADQREQSLQRIAARLGISLAGFRARVFLHSSLEDKVLRGNSAREVHSVMDGGAAHHDAQADATALLVGSWGEPAMPFLRESAAVFAAGEWRGRPTGDLAAQIVFEEGPYSLTDLTDDSRFLSPLVRQPLAGEFAAWVGLQRLRVLYTAKAGNPKLSAPVADWRVPLEKGWRQHLRTLAATWKPEQHDCRGNRIADLFHRGIALSHEGGPRGGYGSRRVVRVLRELAAMGADAVSLQPYASQRSAGEPVLRRFTAESDDALDHSTRGAHAAGLRVTLKPQIWIGGGRSTPARATSAQAGDPGWSGDISFAAPAAWDEWWRQYRQWILHYARLAEGNGTDLFVIGTELGGTTAPERGQEEKWRRLIADVRRVYHGPVTYAAHWGQEFETLPFWDALDFIGLNFYYPIASGDGALSAEAAGRVAETVERVQERWAKPVLFTEVGFPSSAGAARQPWREDFQGRPDPELQARCYELVFRTFYSRPWFHGLYWWKWHSNGRGGGPSDLLYTPQRKPAERVIAHWYQHRSLRP